MIKREYKTKEECVELFIDMEFDMFPSWVVTDNLDYYAHWEFVGLLDEDEQEATCEKYGYTHEPMWNTWFIPSGLVSRFIERNDEKVMDMGFTLIYHDDELFAIGIDGCGYNFRDTHFTRLYDAIGFEWHK